jgi:hypothetical protein
MDFRMADFHGAPFQKADPTVDPEAARLKALSQGLETRLREAFLKFVRDCQDTEVLSVVADRLARGDVEGALALIDIHIRALATTVPLLFQDAAIAEASALASQIRIGTAISFDPGNPIAATLMRRSQLEFLQAMTDSQRDATRAALAEGLERGLGYQEAARLFRDSIGLSAVDVAAVSNYERLLRTGSAAALDRQMRDMRFDPTVERSIEEREPLSEDQIGRMVDAYRRRALAFRAVVISRTESGRIMSEAQEVAMDQVIQQGGMTDEDVEQTWLSVDDDRTRDTHAAMQGQVRPKGVPFDSPSGARLRYPCDPQAPAAEVCNCRCKRLFRIKLRGAGRLAA